MNIKCNIAEILYVFCFILLVSHVSQSQSIENVCVMREVCGDTEFGVIPCNNQTGPQVLKPVPENLRSLTLFEAMCPHLHNRENPIVCCDEFQLESMFVTLYNLAHMGFNHCPQCLRNLEKLFCQMYCSPEQNQFIKAKKIKKNDSGGHVASEIDYHLNQDYAEGIFESCKDVRNFEGRVMDSLCGGKKGDDCTVRDWLQFMGKDIENEGLSPFTINFHITKEKEVKVENKVFKPLSETYLKCSEGLNENLKPCDCHHCPQSCPKTVKRETNKCLMKGICDETAFGGIPCVADEEPTALTDSVAMKELMEMCPHLAGSDNPLLCCTDDQVIRLNQTFEMISMFLKECPSCVRNFEKVICHLSCSPNQSKFMRITKSDKNNEEKEIVSEVEYFLDDGWAKGVYDSCKGVHRLGFNVLDHYCKPYKFQDCDHQKFLQFIGGDEEHFGHSPFQIKFKFTSEDSVESNGVKYIPAKESHYKCTDNPHTGEGGCPCIHCEDSCAPGEERVIQKQLPKYKQRRRREAIETEMDQSLSDKSGEPMCLFKIPEVRFTSLKDKRSGKLCLEVRKPIPLNSEESIETLREICPHLVDNGSAKTCCDESFINQMKIGFKLASMWGLSKCRACLDNFKQTVCEFACSPRQNSFLRVMNATKTNNNCLAIDRLEYYVNTGYAQTLFDSCKALFGRNLTGLMCKQWGLSDNCSIDKWLQKMGLSAKKGGYSPFQIDFKLSDKSDVRVGRKTIVPMNASVMACNEIIDGGEPVCDCDHCFQSCG